MELVDYKLGDHKLNDYKCELVVLWGLDTRLDLVSGLDRSRTVWVDQLWVLAGIRKSQGCIYCVHNKNTCKSVGET